MPRRRQSACARPQADSRRAPCSSCWPVLHSGVMRSPPPCKAPDRGFEVQPCPRGEPGRVLCRLSLIRGLRLGGHRELVAPRANQRCCAPGAVAGLTRPSPGHPALNHGQAHDARAPLLSPECGLRARSTDGISPAFCLASKSSGGARPKLPLHQAHPAMLPIQAPPIGWFACWSDAHLARRPELWATIRTSKLSSPPRD